MIIKLIYSAVHISEILYSDLAATMPFGSSVDTFELRGDHLKEVFERAVNDVSRANGVFSKFDVQVSGWFCIKYLKYFVCYR